MKEYLIADRAHQVWNGTQQVYRFPNGYGASVIRGGSDSLGIFYGSYGADEGLFELAVVKFTTPPDVEEFDFELQYDTPITDDVLGHLSEQDVQDTLVEIKNLEG